MKLSKLFALSILLCVFAAALSVISPVSAAPVLQIKGVPKFLKYTEQDLLYVFGEVQNTGDAPAGSLYVYAEFVDYEGWPLVTGGGEFMLDIIHPGEICPFDIVFTGPEVEAIEDANWNFQFSPTTALPTGLEIVSHSSDSPGSVVGEIQNIGDAPTTQITVAATFYNPGGVLVGTASSDPIPGPLNPGENATFSITLEYGPLLPEIDSYALYAQSQEYAIIPEFPILASMLLILMMLTVATAIYKRRLPKTPNH